MRCVLIHFCHLFSQHASYEAPDQDEEEINEGLVESEESKASFQRRTSHAPNPMQMRLNKTLSSFTMSSVHVKFNI